MRLSRTNKRSTQFVASILRPCVVQTLYSRALPVIDLGKDLIMSKSEMNDSTATASTWIPTHVDITTAPNDEHMVFKVTKILVYLFIFIVSMLGNVTVIAIVCRSRIMRSVAGNFLILNLALCDFLTPFLSIPFDLAVEEKGEWLYGPIMCKVLFPAATWTTTSSSLTLAVIAFDRYRCLMHPFESRLTITHVKRLIVGMHGFSLLVVIPYAYVLDLTEEDHCREKHWFDPPTAWRQVYTMSLFVVQYLAPLLFMTYMYGRTSERLFTSTEKVRTSSMSSVESETGPRSGAGSFGNTAPKAEPPLSRSIFKKVEQEQNVKITKMFIVVVIIFAVCMLPNQVVWLWSEFGTGHKNKNFKVASIVCRFFTYTNCCLNPLIFFKFSREFRRGLRRVCLKAGCSGTTRRRKIILAFRRWRASRSRAFSITTQSTTIKSGRDFSSPSQDSHTSTNSAFENERKLTKPKRPQREKVTAPQGFWRTKMDNLKMVSSCTASLNCQIKGNPQEMVTNSPGECAGKLHNTTKIKRFSLSKETLGNIEIKVRDLMTLPHLMESCC